jgi:uncharacterized protein (TIGR02466 family)
MVDWPNSDHLNTQLRDVVLRKERESSGIRISNRGGWQSENDLATWDEPCVAQLRGMIEAAIRDVVRCTVAEPDARHYSGWTIEAWANINREGALNVPHVHTKGGTKWAGIYYVSAGSTGRIGAGGLTKFQDRSLVPKETLNHPDPFEREFAVVPQPGLMVLFPGTLWHYVEPYHGSEHRITIAFNLRHPGFTIPYYEPNTFWWTNFRGIMRARDKLLDQLSALFRKGRQQKIHTKTTGMR